MTAPQPADPSFVDLVDPTHTALLVIDIQNDGCHPDGVFGKLGRDISLRQSSGRRAKGLIDRARAFGVPIIFTQGVQTDDDKTPYWYRNRKSSGPPPYRVGTWGAEFFEVEPRPEDTVIIKTRLDAFIRTELEAVLKERGVTTLLLTGGSTNACIEATAWHADMLDYDVVVLADCCGSTDAAEHASALKRIADRCGLVVESAAVLDAWQARAADQSEAALATPR
jgi:ureidoacrylate peracid hydrolase